MSGPGSARIVQLTDCHLFADPNRELVGFLTGPRFEAVLADIAASVPEFDLLVVTGDTAHDEAKATYEAFRDRLGDLAAKLRILPGNHDDRGLLRTVFPTACVEEHGRIRFRETLATWNVLGLDSHRPGETAGSLGSAQLEQLAQELEVAAGQDTLLFLHHPPIAVGSEWLDAIGLDDAASLASLVEEHDHVRLIVCGHVHQEVSGQLGGAVVLTTPAVGVQFQPLTPTLTVEPDGTPGYRVIELHAGGNWSTSVRRLPRASD